MLHFKKIEQITREILKELNISQLPINIKKVVESKGLAIQEYNFKDDVSGVLVIQSNIGTIGVNPSESAVRKRFTIAHELGHYILHKNEKRLFVDKEFTVAFRSQRSTPGTMRFEQEANVFAAAILMPEDLVLREVQKNQFNFTDDKAVQKLAKTFDVSISAMSLRLAKLDLFHL